MVKSRYRRRRRRYRRPTYRRKSYRRRYKKMKMRVGGFGSSKMVKLRYASAFSMTIPADGNLQIKRYRANSVYDPDWNTGGHQPMNFDTYAALYHKYTVLGSKLTMKYICHQGGTTTGVPMIVGVMTNDDETETAYSNIHALIENGRIKYNVEAQSVDSYSGKPKVITKYFSAKKFFRVRDVVDNHQLGALVTQNPSQHAYFDIIAGRFLGTSGTMLTVSGIATIDYLVKFRILKDQELN